MLTAPATPHLKRSHATMLVLAVLLLHWWVLAGAPLWWSPEKRQTLRPQAMVTRTIEASTPRAAQVPTVKPNRVARPPADLPKPPQGQVDIKEHDWAAALLIAEEAGQTVKRPDFVGDFGSVNL